MKHLDLFAGIGGFSLGFERAGMETVAFCEQDEFCQKVLAKHWPDVPIYNDVRTMNHDGPIDIISGGYPCQPFSISGKQEGADDDRHQWPAMLGIIQKHRPLVVVGENVTGHISLGFDDVLSDMEREGYSTRAFIIPACSLNARHRRDRIFFISYSKSIGIQGQWPSRKRQLASHDREGLSLRSCEGQGQSRRQIKSGLDRMPNGFPAGLDGCLNDISPIVNDLQNRRNRIKALGNAVVPQLTERIARSILQTFKEIK